MPHSQKIRPLLVPRWSQKCRLQGTYLWSASFLLQSLLSHYNAFLMQRYYCRFSRNEKLPDLVVVSVITVCAFPFTEPWRWPLCGIHNLGRSQWRYHYSVSNINNHIIYQNHSKVIFWSILVHPSSFCYIFCWSCHTWCWVSSHPVNTGFLMGTM